MLHERRKGEGRGRDKERKYNKRGKKGERKKPNFHNDYLKVQYPQEHELTYHKHGSFSDSFPTSSPCF